MNPLKKVAQNYCIFTLTPFVIGLATSGWRVKSWNSNPQDSKIDSIHDSRFDPVIFRSIRGPVGESQLGFQIRFESNR